MSTTVTLNSIPYIIPATGEVDWGQNVSNYLIALPSGMLTLAGGNFPLMNDANFGPTKGIISPYYKSTTADLATAGQIRLGFTDTLQWRNSTNTANITLGLDAGNQLSINGASIVAPLTTKGDLYTFSTISTRQPVGLNGQSLVADSGSPTGLSWQTLGGAGGGSVIGFTFTPSQGVTGLVTTPTTTPNLTLTLGTITPAAVAAVGTVTGSNLSGTNTGNQTITLTGDVTGSGTGTFAATLSNTGVTPGTYNNANITVDAKGRITAASGAGGAALTTINIATANGVSGTAPVVAGVSTITLALGNITPTSVTTTNFSNYGETLTNVTWGGSISLSSSSTNVYRVTSVFSNIVLTLPTLTDLTSTKTYTIMITAGTFTMLYSLSGTSTLKWRGGVAPTIANSTNLIILTGYPVSASRTDWFGTTAAGYF